MMSTDLTIVLCTANRADDLAFTLRKMAAMRLPEGRSVQFIIVDNGSTDATGAVLKAAARTLPFPIEVLHEPNRGLARARNTALRKVRGAVIAWIDDDCIPQEDWLERLLAHFDAEAALDFLTGRVELYDPTHHPITINTSREPAVLDGTGAYIMPVIGGNMAFRRRVVERIGRFDERFGAGGPLRGGEDTDFGLRTLRMGGRLIYAPDVVVFHNHKRVTHEQVMRLRRSYSYADGALLFKHAIAGDGQAARRLYWTLRGLVRRVIRPEPWLRSRHDNARLLLDCISGAGAFLRHARLRGDPAVGIGRPDASRSMRVTVDETRRGAAPSLRQRTDG